MAQESNIRGLPVLGDSEAERTVILTNKGELNHELYTMLRTDDSDL